MADQLGVYYSFQRKTLKWWVKVFFWLVEVTVVNSYITYKQIVINPKSHLAYRRTLIEVLAGSSITNAPPRPRIGRPRKLRHSDEADPERLNQKLHLLGKWEKQKDCVVFKPSFWIPFMDLLPLQDLQRKPYFTPRYM